MHLKKLVRKYVGDRAFYAMVLGVAVPIMIQNGITNFVSMLDNIMVGQMGTESMSGVAIVNQLLFVFSLCVFGGVSGAGIFGAQFYGNGNHEGLRSTLQFKLILSVILTAVGTAIYMAADSALISLYLHDGSESGDIAATLEYGIDYMAVMLIGLLPFAFTQAYASTLRETGETIVPMLAGVAAVLVNLCLNYVLIFGHFGFEAMGVRGAAIATVISRFVELAIIMIWTHMHLERNRFAEGLFTKFTMTGKLVRQIIVKGMPLMFNELLWSMGIAILNQCYSMRGLDAVAAINISSTISNVFSVVYMALGSSVGIIVGQKLGAGDMTGAKDTDNKMIAFAVASCLVVGVLLFAVAPLFPDIYNTTDTVRHIAASLIRVTALSMPMYAFANASYFTLRSGGKTGITFVFDCGFVWAVALPTAMALARLTSVPIVPMFAICQAIDLIKCLIGYILVKKDVWIHNLVVE